MIPEWATQLRDHDDKHRVGELVGYVAFDAYVIRKFGTEDFKFRLGQMVEDLVGHREGVSVLPSYHEDLDQWKFTVFALRVPSYHPAEFVREVDSVPNALYA